MLPDAVPPGNIKVALGQWDSFDDVTLSGLRTSVEPVKAELDTADIFAAATESEESKHIFDHLSYGPFTDKTAMRDWLLSWTDSKDPVFIVFRDKTTGKPGGMGCFMRIQTVYGVAEMGRIWFALSWQDDVRATEALSLMMYHVLETKVYRRLEWKCDALNTASRFAALRLGFRYEGIFFNHMIIKGRNRDTAWFSLTQEEWPSVRAAHARWLSPENFDSKGRQKYSLRDLTRALW